MYCITDTSSVQQMSQPMHNNSWKWPGSGPWHCTMCQPLLYYIHIFPIWMYINWENKLKIFRKLQHPEEKALTLSPCHETCHPWPRTCPKGDCVWGSSSGLAASGPFHSSYVDSHVPTQNRLAVAFMECGMILYIVTQEVTSWHDPRHDSTLQDTRLIAWDITVLGVTTDSAGIFSKDDTVYTAQPYDAHNHFQYHLTTNQYYRKKLYNWIISVPFLPAIN